MHQRQEIDMLPPTFVSLYILSRFTQVSDALAALTKKQPRFFLPRVSFHQEHLTMLYPGDAAYETLDAENTSQRHRCIHDNEGWHYIDDAEGISI
jgi:hypothetical protein